MRSFLAFLLPFFVFSWKTVVRVTVAGADCPAISSCSLATQLAAGSFTSFTAAISNFTYDPLPTCSCGNSGPAGSSASLAPPPAPTGSCTPFAPVATILRNKGASGHVGTSSGGLQFSSDDSALHATLLGQPSCGSFSAYVVPNDLTASYLWRKVSQAPPCGSQMPLGSQLTQVPHILTSV